MPKKSPRKPRGPRGPYGLKFGPRAHIGGWFHPDLAAELRNIAIKEDTRMQAVLIEAFNLLLAKHNRPEIAGVMPAPENQ